MLGVFAESDFFLFDDVEAELEGVFVFGFCHQGFGKFQSQTEVFLIGLHLVAECRNITRFHRTEAELCLDLFSFRFHESSCFEFLDPLCRFIDFTGEAQDASQADHHWVTIRFLVEVFAVDGFSLIGSLGFDRLGLDEPESIFSRIKPAIQFRFGKDTGKKVDYFSLVNEIDGRYRGDLKGACRLLAFFRFCLHQKELAISLLYGCLKGGRQHPARGTPFCPEVHDDGGFRRSLHHILLECFVRCVDRPWVGHGEAAFGK